MKTKYFLLLLTLFFAISHISSQDIFDAMKQVAEMENEADGEENDSNGASAETKQEAEDWWNQELDENAGILDGLKTKEEQCFAIIMLWAYGYQSIINERQNAENCKMKYDLYGMQILALTAGNTFMYCTEDLFNFSEDNGEWALGELAEPFFKNYFENLDDYMSINHPEAELKYTDQYSNKPAFAKKIHFVLDNWEGSTVKNANTSHHETEYYGAIFNDIIFHLTPINFAGKVYRIGETMEALGCGG